MKWKKNIVIIFQKGNGNSFTLLITFIVKSLQKSKIAKIYYHDPQSAGINLQSLQSDLTYESTHNYLTSCRAWETSKIKITHKALNRILKHLGFKYSDLPNNIAANLIIFG